MKVGKVKWFNSTKGFGFLNEEGHFLQDIFFHYSVIDMPGYKEILEGDRVEFEMQKTEKGFQATYVKKVTA